MLVMFPLMTEEFAMVIRNVSREGAQRGGDVVEMVEGTGVLRHRREEMKGQDKHMQNSK